MALLHITKPRKGCSHTGGSRGIPFRMRKPVPPFRDSRFHVRKGLPLSQPSPFECGRGSPASRQAAFSCGRGWIFCREASSAAVNPSVFQSKPTEKHENPIQKTMPYRKLPNSDTQFSAALDSAWNKWLHTSDSTRLITPEQARQLEDPPNPIPEGYVLSLRAQFKKELADVGPALRAQTDVTEDLEHAAAALSQITSHFIQVFNFAVQRGVFARSDRAFYGLDVSGSVLPTLNSYDDAEQWAQKLVDGEKKRLEIPGAVPMAMPAASEVATALAAFRNLRTQQSAAKDAYGMEIGQVDLLRPQIVALIGDLWDTIEFNLRKNDGPTLRRFAREWGVVYLTRPGETPDPAPATPTSETPTGGTTTPNV